MNIAEIEGQISELRKTSSASFIMIILGATCLIGSLYYSATRLTPLEERISILSNESMALENELSKKQRLIEEAQIELKNTQTSLSDYKKKLESTNAELNNAVNALVFLQGGVSYLLNRQYPEAIDSFGRYLELRPDSHEALNFLGYAELRYAQFWRENSKNNDISNTQRNEYIANTINFSRSAESHLSRAQRLNKKYAWPSYNLALLHYQSGKKTEALDQLSELLTQSPSMLNWLCEDGQFRKFRIDKETADRFTKIVEDSLESQQRKTCWVIKPPV